MFPFMTAPTPGRPLATQSGAFDLPSIMIGVAVVSILTVGVLAAIFGVIPWAQDRAAQQDLVALHTAQGAAYSKDGGFTDRAGLMDADLLGEDTPAGLEIQAAADGLKYVGVNYSETGNGYITTSEEPTPRELHNHDTWPDGRVIDRDAKDAPPIMVTIWKVTAGQTLTLPIYGDVNVTIDWGDGTVDHDVRASNPGHVYGTANSEQRVVIEGKFDSWGSGYRWVSAGSLISVDRWGETGTVDLVMAFRDADNLKHVEAIPRTTDILHGAFHRNDSKFTIGDWDTSGVTNMTGMFHLATAFNQPLHFDTKNVRAMARMFQNATAFDQDLSEWDVNKVTDWSDFSNYSGLTPEQLPKFP